MATQGLLSIIRDGKVVVKAVTGADGYDVVDIAEEVRRTGTSDPEAVLKMFRDIGHSGPSLIVQYAPDKWLGDYDDDELPPLYAEKFSDPRFNPRWECGLCAYTEVVDVTRGPVRPILHKYATPPRDPASDYRRTALCGQVDRRGNPLTGHGTDDPAQVTCKRCRKIMEKKG